ncbi:hypothetical protein LZZ90_10395 [Flavobacterium sp. SM15]|uniref:hypothetical protein n=1 Tax=Flavobacterium sp. SM15 TaxID=2908005 RepID=UPI001EDAEA6F|nr:hypothetical protein [Flavobacterium sp. SM15]MCG2611915.1 hypothetical protein [Flavobacterium sp. SM15]
MTLKTKALIYNFIGFALLFVIIRIVAEKFTNLSGFWLPLTAAVVASILAPKFQAVRTNEGEKIFMKWLFIKGVKEIK